MDYWKKQNLNIFIKGLKGFYSDPSSSSFKNDYIINKLNLEETQYLNQNLNFEIITGFDSKFILNYTLKNPEKNNFSYFLIRSHAIDFEIINISPSGETVFMLLAKHYFFSKEWFPVSLFLDLFIRGYKAHIEDHNYIKELYQQIRKPEDFEKWCMLRYAVLLDNTEQFNLALKKDRILYAFVSFKLQKPVSFNFPNLLGVAINAISHYRECGDLILKAIDIYGCNEKIQKLDLKKGTFHKKVLEYIDNRPIQNEELEEVILTIFPELKETIKSAENSSLLQSNREYGQ